MKACLFKYTKNVTTKKKPRKFSDKNSDIFHISTQNLYCRYSLEPPRRGGSNVYLQSMFGPEIGKIIYTPITSVLLYKSGVSGGQHYIGVFS